MMCSVMVAIVDLLCSGLCWQCRCCRDYVRTSVLMMMTMVVIAIVIAICCIFGIALVFLSFNVLMGSLYCDRLGANQPRETKRLRPHPLRLALLRLSTRVLCVYCLSVCSQWRCEQLCTCQCPRTRSLPSAQLVPHAFDTATTTRQPSLRANTLLAHLVRGTACDRLGV